jgi:poly(3-hydroxybutyrate) depolymerase
VPESGEFLVRSYSNQVGIRAYKLYVPSGYRGQPLPLIVMLHGCTQSPDDFAAGTRMNSRAEEHNCFVAYPARPPRPTPPSAGTGSVRVINSEGKVSPH